MSFLETGKSAQWHGEGVWALCISTGRFKHGMLGTLGGTDHENHVWIDEILLVSRTSLHC